MLEAIELAKLCTIRVGGICDYYFRADDLNAVVKAMQRIPEHKPITWLGLGSNVLFADAKINSAIIHTKKCFNTISSSADGSLLVGAGVTCPNLAKYCMKQDMHDAGFLAGIPGTIGGAVCMNAGAFGGEIGNFVTSVKTIDRTGEIQNFSADEIEFSYRTCSLPKDRFIIEVKLSFDKKPFFVSKISQLLLQRKLTQPIGKPSFGSVFKNPEGNYAAKLIESVGLKGKRFGNAIFSDKHCNFIINTGNASYLDVMRLIDLAKEKIFIEHNIELELEVKIIK